MRPLFVLLILTACDIKYEPDVGDLSAPDAMPADDSGELPAATGRCTDSDPSTTVSFAAHIRPLLARSPGSCTGCHGTSATSGFSIVTYEALRTGGQVSGTRIVVAGKPCDSVLLQKLGPAPPFGTRMPYSGPPFYSAADLALVRDWIAEGAHDN